MTLKLLKIHPKTKKYRNTHATNTLKIIRISNQNVVF